LHIKISTPLLGSFQNYNSALAVLSVHQVLNINDKAIISGLNNVIRNSGIQGRYEIYCPKPKVIFDSAHNEEGVRCFLSAFRQEAEHYSKRILIFGVMRDKAVKEMLKDLSGVFDEIWFTSIDSERSKTKDELMQTGNELNINTFVVEDAVDFINRFISKNSEECLVILGSMYVLGDIKTKLLNKKA